MCESETNAIAAIFWGKMWNSKIFQEVISKTFPKKDVISCIWSNLQNQYLNLTKVSNYKFSLIFKFDDLESL